MIHSTDTWTEAFAKLGVIALALVVVVFVFLLVYVGVQTYREWVWHKAYRRWHLRNSYRVVDLDGRHTEVLRPEVDEPRPRLRRGLPFSHLIRERKNR